MTALIHHSCNENARKLLRGHPSVDGGFFWHLLGIDRLVSFCPWCGVPLELARLMPEHAVRYEQWATETVAMLKRLGAAKLAVLDRGVTRADIPNYPPPKDLGPQSVTLKPAAANADADAEIQIAAVNAAGDSLLRVYARPEAAAELRESMLASGMHELRCTSCGTEMFTRVLELELCPDCEAKS